MAGVIRLGTIVLFLVAWEMSVRLGWIDPLFLASPIETAAALIPSRDPSHPISTRR